jgi:hypothetical protein
MQSASRVESQAVQAVTVSNRIYMAAGIGVILSYLFTLNTILVITHIFDP